MDTNPVVAFWMPGGMEWMVIGVIALLIFGRKLPEMAKGLGQGLVEFKKGLTGVQDEVDDVDQRLELETHGDPNATAKQDAHAEA